MDLTHSFTVPADIEETWRAFNDIADVANCFPGASVTSAEGDEFKGSVKVKLGPISLLYNGSGTFVERDEAAHRFVVEAKGKDKRGNGTAGATVTASMADAGGGRTEVTVLTDLSITGKPAQFGRGMIEDVSNKLLDQFVACLGSRVGAPAEAAPSPEPAAAASSAEAAGAAGGAGGASGAAGAGAVETAAGGTPLAEAAAAAAAGAPGAAAGGAGGAPGSAPGSTPGGPGGSGATPRPASEPVEALDLGATVLPILVKSYWKQAAAGLLVILVLRRLFRCPRCSD